MVEFLGLLVDFSYCYDSCAVTTSESRIQEFCHDPGGSYRFVRKPLCSQSNMRTAIGATR